MSRFTHLSTRWEGCVSPSLRWTRETFKINMLIISTGLNSALVVGFGITKTPPAARGTWLPVPLHAVIQCDLLSSTKCTALLWEQLSAPCWAWGWISKIRSLEVCWHG